MKPFFISFTISLLLLCSCGSKNKSHSDYPENFNKIGDIARVEWAMKTQTPDSLARFIIDSALGRNENARIDSLANATLYVYEHLKGDDLDAFSIQYDSYVEALPLDDKMKVYLLAGSDDPQKLGYRLGLEYVGSIRENNKNVGQVEKELESFRKACGEDTATYRRFIIGFHTVLAVDSGKDISKDIYDKFINYD